MFFLIPASIVETAAVIPNWAKIFFANGTATFINGPASLFNNDPKTPPGWIILEAWALENFKLNDILLLNAFLSFFVLLSIIIHDADHFNHKFSNSFSELFLFYV